MNGKLWWLAPVLIVLTLIVVWSSIISAAVDCGNRGGEFVRNWAGWYVCVGETR